MCDLSKFNSILSAKHISGKNAIGCPQTRQFYFKVPIFWRYYNVGEGRSNREIYPGDELGAVWDFFIVISAHLSYCNIASLRFPIFPDEENEKKNFLFFHRRGMCQSDVRRSDTLTDSSWAQAGMGWVGWEALQWKKEFLISPPFH